MVEGPKSILVVKPSSFGDVVHTLPAVALLKRAWPQARLTWLINPEWMPLVDGNSNVAAVVPFPRASFRGLKGGIRFLRWCRGQLAGLKPDLTIDFQGLLRSAWMGRASCPRMLVGMSDAREGARFFYHEVASMPSGILHSVERYLETAKSAVRLFGGQAPVDDDLAGGAGEELMEAPSPQANVLPSRFLLLHPYARGTGKSLSDRQVEVICRLVAPFPVVLVGKKAEPSTFRLPENCLDLLEQTSLPQLIGLIRRAAVVVTVDSGPSHLAAALRRPMIAIHTWSDPRRVGPYFEEARVWKNGRILAMREIRQQDEAFFRSANTSSGDTDVARIAATAISLSSSSA